MSVFLTHLPVSVFLYFVCKPLSDCTVTEYGSGVCCLQNNIPMFSPALTDGAIGDMLYLFSYENPGLILDITQGKTSSLVI